MRSCIGVVNTVASTTAIIMIISKRRSPIGSARLIGTTFGRFDVGPVKRGWRDFDSAEKHRLVDVLRSRHFKMNADTQVSIPPLKIILIDSPDRVIFLKIRHSTAQRKA